MENQQTNRRAYVIGSRIRYQGRTGTVSMIDKDTGALTSIKFDDGTNQNFVYLNSRQEEFLKLKQPDVTLIAGRGWGKSRVIGNKNYDRMIHLPRAKFFFSSTTYAQLLTKTLPPIEEAWYSLGLREYKSKDQPGHYVVGKRPPSEWAQPYKASKRFENLITFFNGYTIELLSMDRPDLARGGTYDGGDIDEALLVKKEHIDKILYPSIRDGKHRFNHWLHGQLIRYSSMPWLTLGQYLLDYKQKAKVTPAQYGYLEGTVMDNIAVLGPEYFERLRLELDPYTFALEVLNQPSGKKQHGFYHGLDENYHTYQPDYLYGNNERGITVVGSKDYYSSHMLHASFDFHGWFKCATIYQERNREEYMINSFYKKEDKGIDELIDDICIHYANHGHKRIHIWGEPHGHDVTIDVIDVYTRIKNRFAKNGWVCEIKAPRKTSADHSIRYEIINECLQETNPLLPKLRINQETCKAVIISLQNAEVNDNFQKSKKDEKNKSYNQAYATHFSDTVDYYIMQKYASNLNKKLLPGRGDGRIN